MTDLRIATTTGVIVEGVRYDHPELQRHRAESEQLTGYPSVIVRVEIRQHVGAVSGTGCQVRTLTGRLLCIASPVAVVNPDRQARAPLGRRWAEAPTA